MEPEGKVVMRIMLQGPLHLGKLGCTLKYGLPDNQSKKEKVYS